MQMQIEKNRKKGASFLFFAAGCVMIAAALFLVLHNIGESERAGKAAEAALCEMQEAMFPSVQTAPLATQGGDASVEIDGRYYMGVLSIPALDLELPVLAAWNVDDLKIAPCRYAGSLETDDMVVAGHNYRTHFGALRQLSPDDTVSFLTPSGARFFYRVVCVEALDPWQIEEMTHGDWDLTLFTCTTSGSARLAVRCVKSL